MRHGQSDSRAHARSRAPSQRQLRVGEELRHALVEIMRDGHFHDPDLSDVSITVTEVRASPDLRNATAYVTPLGGEEMDKTVAALNRAAGYFRKELARKVTLKFTPKLGFAPDTSFEYSSQIDALLHRPDVARDVAEKEDGDETLEGGEHGA